MTCNTWADTPEQVSIRRKQTLLMAGAQPKSSPQESERAAGTQPQNRPLFRPCRGILPRPGFRGAMQALHPLSRPSASRRTAIVSRGNEKHRRCPRGRVVFRAAENFPYTRERPGGGLCPPTSGRVQNSKKWPQATFLTRRQAFRSLKSREMHHRPAMPTSE